MGLKRSNLTHPDLFGRNARTVGEGEGEVEPWGKYNFPRRPAAIRSRSLALRRDPFPTLVRLSSCPGIFRIQI
ncbi:hypothetical protein Taro_018192 [Colocasia esculenta]|uniref:Uncharacterized protein n=1 Tax=Colocasia esculenta TaxID=4460 RepID=A0A843UQT6_COLES|nr:hypothetical protein [Colocasia esculenta]